MYPRPEPQESGMQELFRAKLRNIINLQVELVQLGELIDWQQLVERSHRGLLQAVAGGRGFQSKAAAPLPERLLLLVARFLLRRPAHATCT
jgi:hypothetical protein